MTDARLSKEAYSQVSRLKLLNATSSDPKFVLEKSQFDAQDNETEATASSIQPDMLIIGRIFPDSEVFKEGAFKIEIKLKVGYPFEPPEVRFLTPIYHPNVDKDGTFSHELLNKHAKYKSIITLHEIVKAVIERIDKPDLLCPLRAEVAREYAQNRSDFDLIALENVNKHALPRR
ncbi:unnamed protein product [Rotaria sp. Silwood2]|nr:unnamed protein product [Rotaria sp. Silwood2]CAF3142000.1 unnamed protein product [Rotaria sp. Silwood2]CAF3303198.1 unnamed protein product [Rotaria sp. Silwood2]CAF3304416.1 unnamed protein product [Rotaria sp. Silwood2]CAF4448012.1 unnamed protein product [Rotaria sp. Silwood2]